MTQCNGTTNAAMVSAQTVEPIFVIGRQHSGNTMLATLLGNVPSVLGVTSEGGFFEIRWELDRLPPDERAERTARRIRDNGVRWLVHESDLPGLEGMWEEITPLMREAARRGADATELYVLGMQQVLERFGKKRFAQKATSYIFLADEILETFPRAKLIFLARNPLDLAASTARRNKSFRHTLRLAMGWNRGVKAALRFEARAPESFLLLRYEDLVRDPEAVVRKTCAFCGLAYDEGYLDVPHVNKSDAPYSMRSEDRGVTASRVFYYRDMLSPVEETAVRLATDEAALAKLYPELAEPERESARREQVRAVGLLASSAALLVSEEGRRLLKTPSRAVRRIAHRLGA